MPIEPQLISAWVGFVAVALVTGSAGCESSTPASEGRGTKVSDECGLGVWSMAGDDHRERRQECVGRGVCEEYVVVAGGGESHGCCPKHYDRLSSCWLWRDTRLPRFLDSFRERLRHELPSFSHCDYPWVPHRREASTECSQPLFWMARQPFDPDEWRGWVARRRWENEHIRPVTP